MHIDAMGVFCCCCSVRRRYQSSMPNTAGTFVCCVFRLAGQGWFCHRFYHALRWRHRNNINSLKRIAMRYFFIRDVVRVKRQWGLIGTCDQIQYSVEFKRIAFNIELNCGQPNRKTCCLLNERIGLIGVFPCVCRRGLRYNINSIQFDFGILINWKSNQIVWVIFGREYSRTMVM